jgi:hypothetical protein
MNIYFSILGLMILSIFAVVVLPVVLLVSFVGFTGLVALYARRTLKHVKRERPTRAADAHVAADTSALATYIRSAYFGARPPTNAGRT